MSFYEPREDSELLGRYVKRYARGRVLDMGTGSGIQAVEAAKKKKVDSVLAVDIDEEVIRKLKKEIKNKKIRFKTSDLFSKVRGKFETIIFNPPYLPEEKGVKDKALFGGKKGHEILERFLEKVNNYLTFEGVVLIVFS